MGYDYRESAFDIVIRIICIVALGLLAGLAVAAELTGQVVGVSDGDTVTVLDAAHQQHKIRLSGIDAPEKRQAYGERSKKHLSDLVYGKSVLVIWEKRDRYGRIVGRVLAPECNPTCRYSRDAGLEQLKAGLAWHYKQYEKEQSLDDRAGYSSSEEQARSRREGLWKEPDAVPPWQFRRQTSLPADRLLAAAATITPR